MTVKPSDSADMQASSAAPVDPSDEVEFRSDVSVELVRASASDSDVLFAARVSTRGEQSLEDVDADASRSAGLVNYLMRDRHGCYDDQTEVLTSQGWVRWPDVTGRERFATLSATGQIRYQDAERVISKHHEGPMIAVRGREVDLLVTPDHNMWAAPEAGDGAFRLRPASRLLSGSHRMQTGGGEWSVTGSMSSLPAAWFRLLGLFIAHGAATDPAAGPEFQLVEPSTVEFLYAGAAELGWTARPGGAGSWQLICDEDFMLAAKKCRELDGVGVVPREVLDCSTAALLALVEGLMIGNGDRLPDDPMTYATSSAVLAGQLQEIALKIQAAATVRPVVEREAAVGTTMQPVFEVTFRPRHETLSRVGDINADQEPEVAVRHYRGTVYCVTVPAGILYVRRNGMPVWCGNSPFEHNSMTFYVSAPIFVFREFMRHRIASYNEESGRYRELRPVFYVPGPERKLVQFGKPGAYDFAEGSSEQFELVTEETKAVCRQAYAAYQRMLDAGVAREVARIVLPVTIFSSMYVTMNARSLMNFLSLRTKHDDSHFKSYPQREIEMVAERMEAVWADLMPVTHAAFERNGRVSP